MYLKRLYNKLRPDDPGWDLPWMAMDQSTFARIMLFLSVTVFPLWAAYMLTREALPDGWLHLLRTSSFMGPILILLKFAASVALSILSWLYRPRITEPIAPSQLFE
jgi:hypothetical protein